MMLKYLFSIIIFFSPIFSQSEKSTFSLKERNLGWSINYDQEGIFSDGYFHYNINSGLFSEIYINDITPNDDRNTLFNLSLGFMKTIENQITIGIGYTNYFNNIRNIEHEVFIGSNYNFLSGIVYYDILEKGLSFQSILNINSMIKRLPLDLSCSLTFDGTNLETFFDISKTFSSNMFIGYIFSREQFEDTKTLPFSKDGKTGTYSIPDYGTSFFNELYIGFYF